jgi:hypothetical protein
MEMNLGDWQSGKVYTGGWTKRCDLSQLVQDCFPIYRTSGSEIPLACGIRMTRFDDYGSSVTFVIPTPSAAEESATTRSLRPPPAFPQNRYAQ